MFRFTIREMLLMIVIAGMVFGWTMEHRQLATVRADAEALARLGKPVGSCSMSIFGWLIFAKRYGYSDGTPFEFVKEDKDDERVLGFSIPE